MTTIQFVAKRERPVRLPFRELKIGEWYTLEDNNGCRVYLKAGDKTSFEVDAPLNDIHYPDPYLLVYPRNVKILVEKL